MLKTTKPSIQDLLERFPKTRPPLASHVQEIHISHYEKNRSGSTPVTSIAQKLERWLHIMVSKDVINIEPHSTRDTLEIGAGNLNHLSYEPAIGRYDIVEPFSSLYKNKAELSRISTIYSDLIEVPYTTKYDRIITIATLEHVLNLPEVIAKSAIHLKKNGIFRVAIPNEGSFLWNLAWRCSTGVEFKLKYGIDYAQIMQHEHVNTAIEVKSLLKHFYSNVSEQYFGINSTLALYAYYECSSPNLELCESFLQNCNQTDKGV
jgi:hypothetical protein